jgi:hypothetical protein
MMANKKPTSGAFGGLYNHEVIRQLRGELAQVNLILAALVEHTGISQPELQKVSTEFFLKQKSKIDSGQG